MTVEEIKRRANDDLAAIRACLQEGYGVEDIAVGFGVASGPIRDYVSSLRKDGTLRAVLDLE